MKEGNYFMLDGKKIPMSEETTKSLRKAQKEVKSYENVNKKLFLDTQKMYFISSDGGVSTAINISIGTITNNCSQTKEQLESILALNQLANVAKYLNDGWLPDWSDSNQKKWEINFDSDDNILSINFVSNLNTSSVFFKSHGLAERAIEILGKETIMKALTLNH